VSRFRVVGLCVGLFAVNGGLNAGIGWFHAAHQERLGPAMFVSAAFMSVAAAAVIRARRPLRVNTASPGTKAWLFCVIVSTAIGLLSWYFYLSSALGAARATFVDYALVPVFAFLMSLAFEPAVASKWRPAATIAIGLVGSVLVILGTRGTSGNAHGGTVVAGIGWTLASSFCGALNLHIARRIADAVEGAILVMLRLAVTALFAVGLAWWTSSPLVHGTALAYAVGLGAVIFGFFFALYALLQRETLSKISPYLFLIPVSTFVFSLTFGTRRVQDTTPLDWLGMALIVSTLVWSEWKARSEVDPPPSRGLDPNPSIARPSRVAAPIR
jgi:drug/metabolite transporter (DMT)-like permease